MAEIMKSVLSKYKKVDAAPAASTQSLAAVSAAPIAMDSITMVTISATPIAPAKVEKAAPAKVITPVVKPVQAAVEVKAEVPKPLENKKVMAPAMNINKKDQEHIEIIAENTTTNEVDIDTDLSNQQEISTDNKLEQQIEI
jgi:hypothetical protein